jgi:Uma2 family endonuclease
MPAVDFAPEFAPELLAPLPLRRHRVSVVDCHRMAEAGVLAPDARVELIDGEVFDTAPMGSARYMAVRKLTRILVDAIGDAAEVACQLPVHLSDHSEPVPDFSVVRRDVGPGLPQGSDVLLVVEVSDSTLAYDVRVKAPLYATHGVAELWIVDIAARRLLRFADPSGGTWQTTQAIAEPGRAALPGLDGLAVDLAGLF